MPAWTRVSHQSAGRGLATPTANVISEDIFRLLTSLLLTPATSPVVAPHSESMLDMRRGRRVGVVLGMWSWGFEPALRIHQERSLDDDTIAFCQPVHDFNPVA